MSSKAATPDLYVLDTLANDVEELDSILRMLNSNTVLGWSDEWGRPFSRPEVVAALSRLIKRDLVEVLTLTEDGKSLRELGSGILPPNTYDDVYFSMTAKGRLVHRSWDLAG